MKKFSTKRRKINGKLVRWQFGNCWSNGQATPSELERESDVSFDFRSNGYRTHLKGDIAFVFAWCGM